MQSRASRNSKLSSLVKLLYSPKTRLAGRTDEFCEMQWFIAKGLERTSIECINCKMDQFSTSVISPSDALLTQSMVEVLLQLVPQVSVKIASSDLMLSQICLRLVRRLSPALPFECSVVKQSSRRLFVGSW